MKPFSSSARRIAPTRPSIMSDGATMSAPARACESASRASSSSVASLSTSLPATTPQWPWSVYSHMQTSVITARPGHVLLDFANRALHLALVVPRLAAVRVLALRDAEQDDRRDAGRVRLARGAHAPGRPTSARRPASNRSDVLTSRPGQTKNGWIRSSGARRVSRIIRRSVSVRRSRRGRLIGNAIGILTPSKAELDSSGTRAQDDYIDDDARRNETLPVRRQNERRASRMTGTPAAFVAGSARRPPLGVAYSGSERPGRTGVCSSWTDFRLSRIETQRFQDRRSDLGGLHRGVDGLGRNLRVRHQQDDVGVVMREAAVLRDLLSSRRYRSRRHWAQRRCPACANRSRIIEHQVERRTRENLADPRYVVGQWQGWCMRSASALTAVADVARSAGKPQQRLRRPRSVRSG